MLTRSLPGKKRVLFSYITSIFNKTHVKGESSKNLSLYLLNVFSPG